MLETWSGDSLRDGESFDWSTVCEETEGMSGSDIKCCCDGAVREPWREAVATVILKNCESSSQTDSHGKRLKDEMKELIDVGSVRKHDVEDFRRVRRRYCK